MTRHEVVNSSHYSDRSRRTRQGPKQNELKVSDEIARHIAGTVNQSYDSSLANADI